MQKLRGTRMVEEEEEQSGEEGVHLQLFGHTDEILDQRWNCLMKHLTKLLDLTLISWYVF